MKKAVTLILALMLLLSLCACGGNSENGAGTEDSSKATIVTNEGETVELSAQDLFDEFDANEARFAKVYQGAAIEFVGTVDYIKLETNVFTGEYTGGGVASKQNKIVFEEGWCLILFAGNTTYDLADYYPGQKLKVSTGILSPVFDTEFLQEVADNNRVVWLVGNDLWPAAPLNSQTTTITIEETSEE